MKRTVVQLTVIAILGMAGCRPDLSGVWFEGGLDAAREEAAKRGTVIMIEFYTDWCNWCRRLETDTFSSPTVRPTLEQMVALRVNAEKKGNELAELLSINSYPTTIFLDSAGREIDRIIGYLPPDMFLGRVERIRAGDTFLDCLYELDEDPADVEAITRSVEGLLDRSDPEGAINRIEAFRRATAESELALYRRLMFIARGELHDRIYQRAARLYHGGWEKPLYVPDSIGTANLNALLEQDLEMLPAGDQASLLRQARFDDAAELLESLDVEEVGPETLLEVSDFAFRSGHYAVASELYVRWYGVAGERAEAEVLNDVAWRLYLMGLEREAAMTIARRSYALQPDPQTADTLARLLYVSGSVDKAIVLEGRAAREAKGNRGANYGWVVRRMEAGEPLDDSPPFESFPGHRRRSF